MILISPSFDNNSNIPRKFTCDGGDINPELQIQNIPPGTKSLALIMHDPDAPRVGGFTHWVVWNINPLISVVKEESVPPGSVEGMNGAGKTGYMGPCPPTGSAHHYHFTLFALDRVLDLDSNTKIESVQQAIKEHLLDSAELIGLYAREN
jgi:Raf kinase inhibitor-like YbhB/YbcL family protein